MKRRISFLIVLCWLVLGCGNGQRNQQNIDSPNKTAANSNKDNITIVNWNIEWFGSTKNGPKDLDLQQKNVQKILQYLNADLFGLCEIVDVHRFSEVVLQLGNQYGFFVSDYAAGVKNRNNANWNHAQKMAFVFNKNVFSNVRVRTFMQKSSRAGYNFSNGRYPFLLEATMQQKGKAIPIAVLLIHAKAGADNNSYTGRLQAVNEMLDSIKTILQNKPLIIMGDFNDVLENSISGKNLVSPYDILLQNGNIGLTLKLSPANGGSTLDYPTIIDNQIINKALASYYVNGSIAIRKDVVNVVSDFKNGKTSDHFPISSSYDLSKVSTIQNNTPSKQEEIPIIENTKTSANNSNLVQVVSSHFKDAIEISVSEKQEDLQFILYNTSNQKVLSVHRRYIDPNKSFFLRCRELPSGNYTLVVFQKGNKNVFKVIKD